MKHPLLFSDKKMFDIDGVYNAQNDRIWAVNRTAADKNGGIQQKWKFPQKVMVWLGVCSKGITPLIIFEKGTVNHERYVNEVLPVALKYGNNTFGDNWIYQQDGATSHTHHLTQQWCRDNFPNFIDKDHWPPNSPDLNPLDYSIWNELVKAIKWNKVDSKVTSIKQLKCAVKKISNKVVILGVSVCIVYRKTILIICINKKVINCREFHGEFNKKKFENK